MVDGVNSSPPPPASTDRQQRRAEHARGRDGRDDDRRADHRHGRPAGSLRRRPSIDQILLQKSPALGGPTLRQPDALRVVAAGGRRSFGPGRGRAARALLSGAQERRQSDPDLARQPLYPDTSPLNVFNRIFGGALPTGTNGAQILAQKESVITYLQKRSRPPADAGAGQRKGPDRRPRRRHQRSSRRASSRCTACRRRRTSVCTKPTAPPNYADTSSGKQGAATVYSDLGGVDYYVPNQPTSHPHLDLGQTQLRLIKAAFACDLVRVATFMWSAGTNWVVFPGTFQGATIAGSPQSTPHHPPSHSDRPATEHGVAEPDQRILFGTRPPRFCRSSPRRPTSTATC